MSTERRPIDRRTSPTTAAANPISGKRSKNSPQPDQRTSLGYQFATMSVMPGSTAAKPRTRTLVQRGGSRTAQSLSRARKCYPRRFHLSRRDALLVVLERSWKSLGRTLDPDDFTDAQAVAAIERITGGNFRLLERLFPRIARVLRIDELEAITDDVIEAAASVLVLGQ